MAARHTHHTHTHTTACPVSTTTPHESATPERLARHVNRPDAPRVVDLFCGAGGTSCGVWQAGGDLVAGVDYDADALTTHAANLPGEHIQHDLAEVEPSILPSGEGEIDWVHMSPPCQGFSQAKGERDPDDDRNQLVWAALDWVEHLQPAVVTMENVAGMASITDHFMETVVGGFRDAGYDAKWRVVNCADYGVPQTRERIFVVGVRADLPAPDRWYPRPTHAETRTTTLDGHVLAEWRTVRDAIGDLAYIEAADGITSQQNEGHQYAGRRPLHRVTEPARTIRCGTPPKLIPDGEWDGAAGVGEGVWVANHDPEPLSEDAYAYLATTPEQVDGSKHRPREFDEPSQTVIANLHKGVPYGLVRIPNHDPVFPRPKVQAQMAEYPPGTTHDSVTERRLAGDQPSFTVVANHTQMIIGAEVANHNPHGGEHHLGGAANQPSVTVTSRGQLQDRNVGGQLSMNVRDIRRLTVREAARLQSFPDWFVFEGTKTAQLKQVGNAVPPRLAQHFTAHIRSYLDEIRD